MIDKSKTVKIGNHEIGGNTFSVIAGPCSIESQSQFLQIAEGPTASFDQANHDMAMKEMHRLKDMPAYPQIGKIGSNGESAGHVGKESGPSQDDCPCCGRKGCERCQCPPIDEDYDGPLNDVTL